MAPGIGGAIGGYIDQRYIYPELFGVPEVEGPRLGDPKLQTASEGSPINCLVGPENRCAGTVVWMSDLHEQRIVEDVGGGGKGGGGGGGYTSISYRYSVDVAIAVCEGEIDAIRKIWANGKLLNDVGSDVSVTSDKLSIQKAGLQGSYQYAFITSASDGPDLTAQLFMVGETLVVSGFSNNANNHEYEVLKIRKAELTGETILNVRCTSPDTVVTGAAGEDVTLFQENRAYSLGKWTDLRVHTGTQTQTADSLIAATEGAADTPAFRGIAYVVFEGLQLADFGNTLPQFSFMVRGKSGGQYIASTAEYVNGNRLPNSRTTTGWGDASWGGGSSSITPNAAWNHNTRRQDASRIVLSMGGSGGGRCGISGLTKNPDLGSVRVRVTFWARTADGTSKTIRVQACTTLETNVNLTGSWQKFQLASTTISAFASLYLYFGVYASWSTDADVDFYISDMRYETDDSGDDAYGDEEEYTADLDGTYSNVELPSALLTDGDHVGELVVIGNDSYPIIANGTTWARVSGDVAGDGHGRDDAVSIGPRSGIVTLAYALSVLLQRAGLTASEYDVSAVSGTMRGIVVPGAAAPLDAIRALVQAYSLVVQDQAGVLVFRSRSALTADTVDGDDLAAHEDG
jgi:hypothetical protein